MQKDTAITTTVTAFAYDDNLVRTVILENGEPGFVASDVCKILGLSNPSEALNTLDSDEKNTLRLSEGIRGNPNVNVINEPGLYRLIFKSIKPEAKKFQKWVCAEVLPQIRKTGGYSIKGDLDGKIYEHYAIQQISESYSKTLAVLGIIGNAAVIAVNQEIAKLTGGAINPLADSGNTYLIADTQEQLYTPTELGKRVNMAPVSVNKRLIEAGLQIFTVTKGKRVYELTEAGKQFGKYLDTGKRHSGGQPVRSVKWSEKVLDEYYIWE
jgi:prophage antirepressor-like protein